MTIAPTRSQPWSGTRSRGRPVMLATLGVPLDEEAAAFAIDGAVETGRDLVVVNVTRLEPLALSMILGYDALPELTPEVSASLESWVGLALQLGVRVERLRVRTPRPVEALIALVGERRPGILVFGPDPSAMPGRQYRRVRRAVLERLTCLVWTPPAAPPVMS